MSDLDRILRCLEHRDWRRRKQAAEELGSSPASRAVTALCGSLSDGNWEVRRMAAASLGKVGGTEAVLPLCRTLEDHEHRVCEAASEALGQIGSPAIAPLAQAFKAARATTRETPIRPWEDERRTKVRRLAVEALGRIPDERTISPLCEALGDPERSVWLLAAEALRDKGDARAVRPLCQVLADEKGLVPEVMEALEQIVRRDPGRALRVALSRIRRRLSLWARSSPAAREAYEEALQRLIRFEKAEGSWWELPLPAAVPPNEPGTLPIPGKMESASERCNKTDEDIQGIGGGRSG
jgi:HEAT repeat protein